MLLGAALDIRTHHCSRGHRRRQVASVANLYAHVGQAVHVLDQHLHAALRNLRDADESRVPLLPVCVLQQRGQQTGGQRRHSVPSQRERDPVQALLPKLIQLPLALALILVRVRPVPVGLVLQSAMGSIDPSAGWVVRCHPSPLCTCPGAWAAQSSS